MSPFGRRGRNPAAYGTSSTTLVSLLTSTVSENAVRDVTAGWTDTRRTSRDRAAPRTRKCTANVAPGATQAGMALTTICGAFEAGVVVGAGAVDVGAAS